MCWSRAVSRVVIDIKTHSKSVSSSVVENSLVAGFSTTLELTEKEIYFVF
jgi:hypothetical protein